MELSSELKYRIGLGPLLSYSYLRKYIPIRPRPVPMNFCISNISIHTFCRNLSKPFHGLPQSRISHQKFLSYIVEILKSWMTPQLRLAAQPMRFLMLLCCLAQYWRTHCFGKLSWLLYKSNSVAGQYKGIECQSQYLCQQHTKMNFQCSHRCSLGYHIQWSNLSAVARKNQKLCSSPKLPTLLKHLLQQKPTPLCTALDFQLGKLLYYSSLFQKEFIKVSSLLLYICRYWEEQFHSNIMMKILCYPYLRID